MVDNVVGPGPVRRLICLLVGVALGGLGFWVLLMQLSGARWQGRAILAGSALLAGAVTLLDTAFQNRRLLAMVTFASTVLFFVLFVNL